MNQASTSSIRRKRLYIVLTVLVVFIIFGVFAYRFCAQAVQAERHARYVGIMTVTSERIAYMIRSMEMNAMNEFDEVQKHLDSPESVIAALHSKTSLNPEVRGYFAAFEPNYFPQKGQWFEPYVHHVDNNAFEVRDVGSANHNYHKSEWYIRAKKSKDSFWSDPYYYNDGTAISGHYTTFVKPIFNEKGQLACVCGADMTFEWLAKELERITYLTKNGALLNRYVDDTDFYTVVINNSDGSCIVSPEGKDVSFTEEYLKRELAEKNRGTVDMEIDGVPSTVYYRPIERVDWTIAVVVPLQGVEHPLVTLVIILLIVAILGILVVWFISKPVFAKL